MARAQRERWCSSRSALRRNALPRDEIQEAYRLQGVNIDDEHIEAIVRQMMRRVKIEEVGDSEFLIDEVVDQFRFIRSNDAPVKADKKPASGRPLLLGITKPRSAPIVSSRRRASRRRRGSSRGGDQRQDRLPARPEGERDHGPPDPGGHGDGATAE